MRIEPLSVNNAENNLQPANPRSSPANSSADSSANPALKNLAAAQNKKTQTQASVKSRQLPLPQFPEDEVTVQFDKPMNDNILIYQFLDKQSGNLILQVPSSQVLGVVHEIQSELREQATQEQAQQSAEENAVKRGGNTDGN